MPAHGGKAGGHSSWVPAEEACRHLPSSRRRDSAASCLSVPTALLNCPLSEQRRQHSLRPVRMGAAHCGGPAGCRSSCGGTCGGAPSRWGPASRPWCGAHRRVKPGCRWGHRAGAPADCGAGGWSHVKAFGLALRERRRALKLPCLPSRTRSPSLPPECPGRPGSTRPAWGWQSCGA